jgi:hypothetical protein
MLQKFFYPSLKSSASRFQLTSADAGEEPGKVSSEVTSRTYANTTPVLRKGSNAVFGKIFNFSVNSPDSTVMKQTCKFYIGPALMEVCPTPPQDSALTEEVNRESSVSKVINDGLNDRYMVSNNVRCVLSITS